MTNRSEGSIGRELMSTNDEDPPGLTDADEGARYDRGGGKAGRAADGTTELEADLEWGEIEGKGTDFAERSEGRPTTGLPVRTSFGAEDEVAGPDRDGCLVGIPAMAARMPDGSGLLDVEAAEGPLAGAGIRRGGGRETGVLNVFA